MKNYKNYLHYIDKNIKNIKPNSRIAITGATGSTGEALAYYLSYLKCNLILLVRNVDAGNTLKRELLRLYDNKIEVYYLDYSSRKSVDDAYNFLINYSINVFFNNAGIYHQPLKNIDGYDITFFVNFLMPIYLEEKINRLNPTIKIINTGSISYRYLRLDKNNLLKLNEKNRTLRYANSKRLLMLYSLMKKKKGFDYLIAHPGISTTNLFNAKNKAYPKLFYIFITPLMKLIFMNPSKAALSLLKSIDISSIDFNHWVGPRGLFHAWGYPNVQMIKEGLTNELNDEELLSVVNNIVLEAINK